MTKTTVRLPKSVEAATVVSVSGHYGDPVERHAPVMTLRIGKELKVVYAPRAGQLLPLTGIGDELRGGDALFALHFEPEEDGAKPLLGKTPARPTPLELDKPPLALRPQLLRVGVALALLAGGVFWVIPLLAEFGFGTTLEARLALALTGLVLGVLAWRLLGRGAGSVAAAGTGLAVLIWSALVVLTLTGANPTNQTVALPDSHALAPAARVRVPPAAPVASVPQAGSLVIGEGSAGVLPETGVVPAAGMPFTALPATVFALTPAPPLPGRIRAMRLHFVPEAALPAENVPVVTALTPPARGGLPVPPKVQEQAIYGDPLAAILTPPPLPEASRVETVPAAPEAVEEPNVIGAAPVAPSLRVPVIMENGVDPDPGPRAPGKPGQPLRGTAPQLIDPAIDERPPAVPDQSG